MGSSRTIVTLLSLMLLGACTEGPDLSAIDVERLKPIRRYDVFQSLATNGKVVVAGTQSGAVAVSSDGGKTWSREALGSVSMLGLAACPDGSFVGIDFNHKVWSANARGTGWASVALDKPRVPLTVTCDARSHWHVGGSRAMIARSADRGASWQITDLGEDAQITALNMIDAQAGIAFGEFGLVARSDDGGATWKKGARIGGEFYPYAAVFVNRTEGYVSGIAGAILRTQDGGASWNKIENAARAPLYRLFLHDGKPYGVGAGGAVARLDGNAFQSMPYPDAVPVFLGAGAALPGQRAIVIGGPSGLVRVVGTQVN